MDLHTVRQALSAPISPTVCCLARGDRNRFIYYAYPIISNLNLFTPDGGRFRRDGLARSGTPVTWAGNCSKAVGPVLRRSINNDMGMHSNYGKTLVREGKFFPFFSQPGLKKNQIETLAHQRFGCLRLQPSCFVYLLGRCSDRFFGGPSRTGMTPWWVVPVRLLTCGTIVDALCLLPVQDE